MVGDLSGVVGNPSEISRQKRMAGLGMWISEHRCPPGSSAQRAASAAAAQDGTGRRRLQADVRQTIFTEGSCGQNWGEIGLAGQRVSELL